MSVSRRLDFLANAYQATLSAQKTVQEVVRDLPYGEAMQFLDQADSALDTASALINEAMGLIGE